MHLKEGGGRKEGREVAVAFTAKGSDYRRPCPAQTVPGWQPRHRWVATPGSAAPSWWPEPSPLQSAEHRVGTGRGRRCVGGCAGDRGDAGLTRYPPYPNGATARWLCLAEGPRCGKGRGAGWSSGPPLRFQPWQADWGLRAKRADEDAELGEPEVRSPGSRRPLLTEGHRRPTAGCLRQLLPQLREAGERR